MTEIAQRIADDWEYTLEEADKSDKKVASLFGYCNGLLINVPYNGYDGDLAEKLSHYHLSKKEKSDLNEILESDREQEHKAGSFDLDDFSVDEYTETLENELHEIGSEMSLMLSYIYGNVPKRGKIFLNFPTIEECGAIICEKDAPRWAMYISGEF